mmetsp:Transcript_26263/g.59354  ORF Transcript_26263/g.59354 Transcript_26263/m.59354 type:complete len:627 (+) Transcript_26263:105-1985(+)
MIANQPAPTPFQSASLYVGDLHNEVTESLLFELFSRVGPVASIRVCRDSVTRRSLGYAYVNFHNVQDAERALDTMNFTEIKKKPCRIMWSQRDPSLRKSGVGNVFVRNLAASMDNKYLYDTFSPIGNILSCKVAIDENGESKGYGYVHFETAEAAQEAIAQFDGTLIDDVEVHVGLFTKRQDRAGQADWTNLYVKQFPVTWEETRLRACFEEYGPVANAFITMDQEGKSRGFGFVNFQEHASAEKALAELNLKSFEAEEEVPAFEMYVSRAQKKNERSREIKTRLDALNHERISKYQGMNLYVKNIADTVNDEQFRETFAPYGTITSARVMKDISDLKASRGFGFVCYSSPEEATRAVTELNGKNVGGKPLVVTLHQRKEHRRAHLSATYATQNMRYPQGMAQGGMAMPPYGMGMFMPQGQPGAFPGQQAPRGGMMYPPNMAGGRGGAGMGGAQGRGGRGAPQGVPGAVNGGRGVGGPMMGGVGQQGPRPVYGISSPQMMQQQPGMRGQQQQMTFNKQARNQNGQMMPTGMPGQMMPMQMAAPSASGDFSDEALASADPVTQKNMIGERLYPLIREHQPDQAGKITGMLLEMDNGELLNLIESPDALMSKIDEALNVLRNHKAAEE